MNQPRAKSRVASAGWCGLVVAAALAAGAIAAAQAPDVFTATAVEGYAIEHRSVPITFVVDRYTTEAEHAAVVAALKHGVGTLHQLLAASPDIGRIIVADRKVALKYAYTRPESRLRIDLLANEPLAFLDPGGEQRIKSEFGFALAVLDFALPGFGSGQLNPAASIAVSASGQVVMQGYGAIRVKLSDVKKQ